MNLFISSNQMHTKIKILMKIKQFGAFLFLGILEFLLVVFIQRIYGLILPNDKHQVVSNSSMSVTRVKTKYQKSSTSLGLS